MTDIRAKGFSSRAELEQYLEDLEDDGGPSVLEDDDDEVYRAAGRELAWVRKEVADLREQLSFGHPRRNAVDGRENRLPLAWAAASVVVTAMLARLLSRSG